MTAQHTGRSTRVAVGLISAATTAALLVPATAGATPTGTAAVSRPDVAKAPAKPSAPVRDYVVISTALPGMARPAAPIVLVAAHPTGNPKDGYIDEQAYASRMSQENAAHTGGLGAAWGAGVGAAVGGLGGAVAGLVLGSVLLPFVIVAVIVGGVVGAAAGAAIGAAIGGTIGAVNGANTGYHDGLGEARWHNRQVRKRNGGTARPVRQAALTNAQHDPHRALADLNESAHDLGRALGIVR
ncbi:hypothetical protein GOARA_048_00610 [Gordonia araii NBRC 100433]|uniref:Glycine zipper domain-containing protein n=1 Tax=Gordonia araii NBRC 100433 TaxID=1073574 RepID=G7H1Y4_9ACTN|nr:hypothetical protein [Gordonia araii]NNG97192.1 hypothetical protein [Gordonia araii NBRC 100433]GAB09859.1 hypothetical protein GOARA_048_00610 [Gordonia araii NBRC 100433]